MNLTLGGAVPPDGFLCHKAEFLLRDLYATIGAVISESQTFSPNRTDPGLLYVFRASPLTGN